MAYERDGFLLLDDFVPLERCDALTARAREIVAVLAGSSAGPVFSAELEHGTEDEYFLNPKGRVRFHPPGPTVFPEAAFQPLPAHPGSVVLLHGSLPHRSGANRSPHSRHAYTCTSSTALAATLTITGSGAGRTCRCAAFELPARLAPTCSSAPSRPR